MNNPDVTEKLSAPAASTPASGSVIICPWCGKPDGVYLYDVPVYERWGNPDSQKMHRKYACKSCDHPWTESKSPNVKSCGGGEEK